MNWNVYYLIFSVVVIVIGIVLLILQPKYKKVQATVTGSANYCLAGKRASPCELSVKYTVNGKEYRNKLFSRSVFFDKVNSTRTIQYLEKKPEIISSNNAFLYAGISLIVIGVIATIVCLFLMFA